MIDVFGGIAKAVEWLAIGIKWILKVALFPLVFQFRILGKVLGVLGGIFKKFKPLLMLFVPFVPIIRLIGFIWKKWLAEPMEKFFEKAKSWFSPVINLVKSLGDAFKGVTDPVSALQTIFQGMKLPGWLQKVIDFFMGGAKKIGDSDFGKAMMGKDYGEDAGEKEKVKREIQKTALSPQTSINNVWNRQKQNANTNNNNVTIQTSSPINSEHAPRIADIMVSSLQDRGRMA